MSMKKDKFIFMTMETGNYMSHYQMNTITYQKAALAFT